MCGRYTLTVDAGDLLEEFGVREFPSGYRPRYNIAPGQEAPVLLTRDGEREIRLFRWGLVPYWAGEPRVGDRMINARAETAAQRPAFREAFRRRRCLVLADGFYEWQRGEGGKVPYWIHLRSRRPFAMAGLWERWRSPQAQEPLYTFAILTTDAVPSLRSVHGRMPVILPGEVRDRWLDLGAGPQVLRDLLRPYPGDDLVARRVSTLVNSPRNDVPQCVEPVEGGPG